MQLVIQSTWDGQPVESTATTTLTLRAGKSLKIRVDASFYGDPPPNVPAGRCPGLWNYEVVELFVGSSVSRRYTEIELGPHGHYLVLTLSDIRQVISDEHEMGWAPNRQPYRWKADVSIPWVWLPEPPWTVNAYAIHGIGEKRRYLAAYPVPGVRPDFHQPHRFQPFM